MKHSKLILRHHHHEKKLTIVALIFATHLHSMIAPPGYFNLIPIEIRIKSIGSHIHSATLEQTLKDRKAYLLVNKWHASWLSDKPFTQSQLLALQTHYNRSQFEIATLMKTPASKEIAQEIAQEAEKSWQEYLKIPNRSQFSYAAFVLPNNHICKPINIPKYAAPLIPSLLFYNHISPHKRAAIRPNSPYDEEFLIEGSLSKIFNNIKGQEIIEIMRLWMQSGIFLHNYHLENYFFAIINQQHTIEAEEIECLTMLSKAGYNLNRALPMNWSLHKSIPHTTLLDLTLFMIESRKNGHEAMCSFSKEDGESNKEQIVLRTKILRMLMHAGAQSSLEDYVAPEKTGAPEAPHQ